MDMVELMLKGFQVELRKARSRFSLTSRIESEFFFIVKLSIVFLARILALVDSVSSRFSDNHYNAEISNINGIILRKAEKPSQCFQLAFQLFLILKQNLNQAVLLLGSINLPNLWIVTCWFGELCHWPWIGLLYCSPIKKKEQPCFVCSTKCNIYIVLRIIN